MTFDPSKLRRDEDFGVPDEVGYKIGWRAWGTYERLPKYGVAPKLYSVTHKVHSTDPVTGRYRVQPYYWVPRQRAEAECTRGNVPPCPCGCGFYSAKNLAHLQSMRYHWYDAERNGMVHIVGTVANWGRYEEGTKGWRSQFSYPLELYVPFEVVAKLGDPLSESYGVPVRAMNTLKPAPRPRRR